MMRHRSQLRKEGVSCATETADAYCVRSDTTSARAPASKSVSEFHAECDVAKEMMRPVSRRTLIS